MMVVGVLLLVLGAVIARVIYFAASRSREYLADAGSAVYTRNPEALASALEKISGSVAGNKLPVPKVAQGLLIVGAQLFATHPPIEKRVGILRSLAGVGSLSYLEYAKSYQQVTGAPAKFMPKSAIAEKPVQARSPTASVAGAVGTGVIPGARTFRREALDALKKSAGYEIHPCACGAKIKIPKNYPKRDKIKCLACGRKLGEA